MPLTIIDPKKAFQRFRAPSTRIKATIRTSEFGLSFACALGAWLSSGDMFIAIPVLLAGWIFAAIGILTIPPSHFSIKKKGIFCFLAIIPFAVDGIALDWHFHHPNTYFSVTLNTTDRSILYTTEEIKKRVEIIDDYYSLVNGPASNLYLRADQWLLPFWQAIIIMKGPDGYAAEVQNFTNDVVKILSEIEQMKSEYGYYSDITDRIGETNALQKRFMSAATQFVDAINTLPPEPSVKTAEEAARLISHQREEFEAAVGEYYFWIQKTEALTIKMRQEELARPTRK